MITGREIADAANEWQLRHDVVENDYVLGWLLAGIAAHPGTHPWAFKGGTCLRKCWFETYRFSEDLDFTVPDEADLDPTRLSEVFTEIGTWLHDRAGIELQVDESSFRRRQNRRGRPTIEARIALRRATAGAEHAQGQARPHRRRGDPEAPRATPGLPSLQRSRRRWWIRRDLAEVSTYSIVELLGEKLRALAERCRPRDLYDVIHMHRHADLVGRAADVAEVLARKCEHAGIEVPTLASMRVTPFREEVETEWANMLGRQLPHLPPFARFWDELDEVFGWLDGRVLLPLQLYPVHELGEVEDWRPARHMTTWRTGAPIEMIRFAGANRLTVTIDYRANKVVGLRARSISRAREAGLLGSRRMTGDAQPTVRGYRCSVLRIRTKRVSVESTADRSYPMAS